jgi:hypothetical protein
MNVNTKKKKKKREDYVGLNKSENRIQVLI